MHHTLLNLIIISIQLSHILANKKPRLLKVDITGGTIPTLLFAAELYL